MKQRIVLWCALFAALGTQGQWRKDSIIPADLLLADLDDLHRTILDSHTDPWRYCTMPEFEAAFDRAREKVCDGLSPVEWLRLMCQTMSVMQDSHSSPDIGHFFNDFVKDKGRALTFGVHSLDDGLYVSDDILHILPRGSKIITINEISATELAAEAAQFGFTEGLSGIGLARSRDMIFQRIFALLHHPLPDFVPVVVQEPDSANTTRTFYYPAKPVKELRKIQNRLPAEEQGSSKTIELSYKDDTVATLAIRSFSAMSQGRFLRQLRESFIDLAAHPQVETLVIDLRNNPGGSSGRMRAVFSYISPDSHVIPEFVAIKQGPITYAKNGKKYKGLRKRRIDKWAKKDEDAAFYQKLSSLPLGAQDTFFYQMSGYPNESYPFEGKKYLAINGLSGSASVAFAAIFKHHKLGSIIGEPCMGPMSGTWGNALPYTLKKTGMRLFLSTIRFAPLGDYNTDPFPIEPDIKAPYTPDHLRNRTDPIWDKIK